MENNHLVEAIWRTCWKRRSFRGQIENRPNVKTLNTPFYCERLHSPSPSPAVDLLAVTTMWRKCVRWQEVQTEFTIHSPLNPWSLELGGQRGRRAVLWLVLCWLVQNAVLLESAGWGPLVPVGGASGAAGGLTGRKRNSLDFNNRGRIPGIGIVYKYWWLKMGWKGALTP